MSHGVHTSVTDENHDILTYAAVCVNFLRRTKGKETKRNHKNWKW